MQRPARSTPPTSKENGKRAEASSSADVEDSSTGAADGAAQGADGTADAARLARTIFVGNVPPATRRHALAKHFATLGPVESVRIRSVASSNLKLAQRAAVIKQAIDTSVRDAVNAYVVFGDEAAVAKAVATNGQVAFGRHLRVDRAVACKRQAEGTEEVRPATDGAAVAAAHKRSVFLGNLAFDVQEEAIWEAFGAFGTVEYVRLVRDAQTQHGKGFGYVCFTERAPVESALSLHETKLNGRTLRVFRCKGEAPARGGAKGGKGGGKAAANPGVDWKNRPAASLRLQLAASAKARNKAKGGIAKKTEGSAAKKAGGNKKLAKRPSAGKPAPTPSQLAQIKAGKNKAKAAAKRAAGGKGRGGASS
jgi:nucleolar protein 12